MIVVNIIALSIIISKQFIVQRIYKLARSMTDSNDIKLNVLSFVNKETIKPRLAVLLKSIQTSDILDNCRCYYRSVDRNDVIIIILISKSR